MENPHAYRLVMNSYLSCPYDLVRSKESLQCAKRISLQNFINSVIKGFFSKPRKEHHVLALLKMVDTYRRDLKRSVFDSTMEYTIALATLTDHFLQITCDYIEEGNQTHVERDNGLIINQYNGNQYSVKKLLTEVDEELSLIYAKEVCVELQKSFRCLPDVIELIDMMNGDRHLYFPSEDGNDQSDFIYYSRPLVEKEINRICS
ncbi:hypothetical protein AB685_23930 [Bacillus sp. LL01]|uniref:hypothetical protein n=1 Tax=Bacillus sp. LL01 TaxID=1665556 RepID=UPI00064D5A44|nr:hypothetical protein [Bacillus sp. LL01]KMJ56061.1 hypothetical protein AB685_23930 [Bacillus sp. LL01]